MVKGAVHFENKFLKVMEKNTDLVTSNSEKYSVNLRKFGRINLKFTHHMDSQLPFFNKIICFIQPKILVYLMK